MQIGLVSSEIIVWFDNNFDDGIKSSNDFTKYLKEIC